MNYFVILLICIAMEALFRQTALQNTAPEISSQLFYSLSIISGLPYTFVCITETPSLSIQQIVAC